jgi:hypothetical protein
LDGVLIFGALGEWQGECQGRRENIDMCIPAARGKRRAITISQARAFSVPIESERRLYFFVLTRFLDANRHPLRWKTL